MGVTTGTAVTLVLVSLEQYSQTLVKDHLMRDYCPLLRPLCNNNNNSNNNFVSFSFILFCTYTQGPPLFYPRALMKWDAINELVVVAVVVAAGAAVAAGALAV